MFSKRSLLRPAAQINSAAIFIRKPFGSRDAAVFTLWRRVPAHAAVSTVSL